MNQVGGDHYRVGARCPHCDGELQHWDVAFIFGFDCFQYIITKWLFRWRKKGGVEDLEKAQHALAKYIEMVAEVEPRALDGVEPEPHGYVDPDWDQAKSLEAGNEDS